jgi:hypothetical protein
MAGSVSLQMMANGGADFPPFRAVIAEYPWYNTYPASLILGGNRS